MATFAQIKEIRLIINDPAGVIEILSGALPGTLAKQTAYLSGGKYYYATEDALTVPIVADLYLSDAKIGALIDTLTTEKVVVNCFQLIITRLGKELTAKRLSSGTESTDYTSLKETYDYYKDMINIWKEKDAETLNVSTGIIGKIKDPEIAGGLL